MLEKHTACLRRLLMMEGVLEGASHFVGREFRSKINNWDWTKMEERVKKKHENKFKSYKRFD